jgi:hypothetical protein
MAAQTVNAAAPTIHKTLVTTTADMVTVSGFGVRAVKVTNRHATVELYAKAVATAATAAITSGADGATFIGAGKTELVPVIVDNAGAAYISVVGNANPYSISVI